MPTSQLSAVVLLAFVTGTASKAADVSLQGWAQQGEPGAAASPTAAGADAPGNFPEAGTAVLAIHSTS